MLPINSAISNEGDRNFAGDIYNRYGKQMYIIAFDILKKKEDDEESAHDVFVKIIDKLDRLKNAHQDDNLMKLLVIAFRNTALDRYDKNKRLASSQFSRTAFDADGESSTIGDFAEKVIDGGANLAKKALHVNDNANVTKQEPKRPRANSRWTVDMLK